MVDNLSDRAGLPYDSISFVDYFNWTMIIRSLEEPRPLLPRRISHGYPALTFGWLVGELFLRVHPKYRTVEQFVEDDRDRQCGRNEIPR